MAITGWDASDFEHGMDKMLGQIDDKKKEALQEMGDELLRLSSREVPHDVGTLESTGVSQPDGNDQIVGYNTKYAARLHEHPEFRFQKGRKGKYLEEPLKHNNPIFMRYFKEKVGEAMR